MTKKIKNLVPGRKYRGYGLLNDFGEFEFVPEETGSREGRVKAVTQGKGFSVSMTSKSILVHINIERKGTQLTRIKELMSKVSEVINKFREYDF